MQKTWLELVLLVKLFHYPQENNSIFLHEKEFTQKQQRIKVSSGRTGCRADTILHSPFTVREAYKTQEGTFIGMDREKGKMGSVAKILESSSLWVFDSISIIHQEFGFGQVSEPQFSLP